MVRYFCVVGPTGVAIADLGYGYLRGMVDQRVRVRALPIGAGGEFTTERRWYDLGDAFTRPMSVPFVNVVCAPCGQLMGLRAPASAFASAEALSPELRAILGPMAGGKSADIDYEPHTVLASLYTVGVKNVAVIAGSPDDRELAALAQYDRVLVPDPVEHAALVARGLSVTTAWDFVHLLEEICEAEVTDPPPTAADTVEIATALTVLPPARGFLARLGALWRSLLSRFRR